MDPCLLIRNSKIGSGTGCSRQSEDHPSVLQVHREFLFTRDYAGLALMMLIVLGAMGFIQIPSTQTGWLYLGVLVLQFALVWHAARNHGRRFVTTVLALKSAGK